MQITWSTKQDDLVTLKDTSDGYAISLDKEDSESFLAEFDAAKTRIEKQCVLRRYYAAAIRKEMRRGV